MYLMYMYETIERFHVFSYMLIVLKYRPWTFKCAKKRLQIKSPEYKINCIKEANRKLHGGLGVDALVAQVQSPNKLSVAPQLFSWHH